MRVCLADTDLQSIGARVRLRHGLQQKSPTVELGSSCGLRKKKGIVSGAATASAKRSRGDGEALRPGFASRKLTRLGGEQTVSSLLTTLNNLLHQMNDLVSIPKVENTYEQLMEIIYGWQKLFEKTRSDLEKANATIVEIMVEKENLLKEHVRLLEESVAAAKQSGEYMKELIDELCWE